MDMLFLGAAILVCALVLLLTTRAWRSGEKRFVEYSVEYDAVIAGYIREDYTKWDTPQVSLVKDGDHAIYRCKSRHMSASTHPRGTKVRVAFYKKKVLGIDFYDVRIVGHENSPYSSKNMQTILTVAGVALFVISILLISIGLDSI